MIKIFNYMLKKYLIGIILASIVLLGINLLIIFISELRHVDQHNYTYATLSKFLIYMLPQNFMEIFPYSLLIGSMISFGAMAYHSEIMAMNTHGISIRKTIYIILLQTFLISSLVNFIANFTTPNLSNKAFIMKNTALNKGINNSSLWFKNKDDFISVNKIITDSKLENIKIYKINDGKLSSVITSKMATYKDTWYLKDAIIYDTYEDTTTNVDNLKIDKNDFIPLQIVKSKFTKKKFLSLEELYENIKLSQSLNIYSEDQKVIFWKKSLLPFSCCIIVFIGLPFLFTPIRAINQSQKIIYGILFGITYFVITSIIINAALILNVPALVCVLLSMAFFIIFGVYLFNRIIKTNIPV